MPVEQSGPHYSRRRLVQGAAASAGPASITVGAVTSGSRRNCLGLSQHRRGAPELPLAGA
jgi:hypothetical protein